MQTKRIFSRMLSLFITATAMAQNPVYNTTVNNNRPPETYPSFQLNVSANKTATGFSIEIQNPGTKKLILKIYHHGLGEVIDTVISSDLFSQRYNMEQAEDGRYMIILSAGKEKIVKEIELNTVTTRQVLIR